ncbi:uncharacterized protein LOC122692778 [Cervus elaphus]|uniref:uncharacterized protein LOC122692778 n=1 Tax=Cervus elaphus TaxID=9860 RepID=UPI001CC27498|nr:uncharacterized protein LOC122692778 [Cervus elaphus]
MGSHKKRIWDLKHKIPFDFPSSERRFWDRVTTGGPKGQVQRWPAQSQGSRGATLRGCLAPPPGFLMWKLSLLRAAQPGGCDAASDPILRGGVAETRPPGPHSRGKVRQGRGGPDWDGWMQTGKVRMTSATVPKALGKFTGSTQPSCYHHHDDSEGDTDTQRDQMPLQSHSGRADTHTQEKRRLPRAGKLAQNHSLLAVGLHFLLGIVSRVPGWGD